MDCTAVVRRTLLHLDAEIRNTGAIVEVLELPTVLGEPTQLGRVFQNLISNACKSARPGRTARVLVFADRVGDAWQFSVADDGAGVPTGAGSGSSTSSKRGHHDGDGGAGIGLAICRTIVERHGGRIWVDDVPGGGSRFSFLIPG